MKEKDIIKFFTKVNIQVFRTITGLIDGLMNQRKQNLLNKSGNQKQNGGLELLIQRIERVGFS